MKSLLTYSFSICLTIAMLVCFADSSDTAELSRDATSIEKISEEYIRGAITLDERVRLQIAAIFHPESLPQQFQQQSLGGQKTISTRCASAVIREIRDEWQGLSASTKQLFTSSFARPGGSLSYVSPGGFFHFHYDTTGANAVPSTDSDMNTVPDFIERCAAYADSSLAKSQSIGFFDPVSDAGIGGDSRLDIYFQEMGSYGFAFPENNGPAVWNDYSAYLVLHRNFLGFAPNSDPEGDQLGSAKATIAHEFHHCVQFAYDATDDTWFMELDATHMEDLVFDACDDNYNYLSGTFSTPHLSLMSSGSHWYSAFPWGLYLNQHFDTSLSRAIWEGARYASSFSSLSDTLMGRYGWTQDSAFAEYAVWNFITSTRDDGLHHEEAATYPLATSGASHSIYPVPSLAGPTAPEQYAATYVLFYPGASLGTLQIHFNGASAKSWRVFSVATLSEGQHTVAQHMTALSDDSAFISIPNFESYLRVALVVINVSPAAGAGTFAYSADIKPPYAVSSSLVTDTNIYSGNTRKFKIKVSNPSPLPDVFDVTVADSFGWTTPSLIAVAVASGTDTTISFNVKPPVGTPLGTQNPMHFRSESWGDSTVFHLLDGYTTTVLYRGDVNFSGGVSIVDVTQLASWLFSGGTSPQPIALSGDFTCSGTVNIADLTSLVARLFMMGPPCPCNPY